MSFSEQERKILSKKQVCVIGCGGLGGYAVELLARSGIGFIRAVDADRFDESNLERQILCNESTLGKSKAQTAKERALQINRNIVFDAVDESFCESNSSLLLKDCDIAIDALDNIPARRILAAACKKAGIPLVYGAISGSYAQVSFIEPGSNIIDFLYPENAQPICERAYSFTPSLAASIQVSQAISYLLGKGELLKGKLFTIDLLTLEQESFDISAADL